MIVSVTMTITIFMASPRSPEFSGGMYPEKMESYLRKCLIFNYTWLSNLWVDRLLTKSLLSRTVAGGDRGVPCQQNIKLVHIFSCAGQLNQ